MKVSAEYSVYLLRKQHKSAMVFSHSNFYVYHVLVDAGGWSDLNTYFVGRQQGDSNTNVRLGRYRRLSSTTHPETIYNETIQV